MFGKVLTIVLLFSTVACAKPRYADALAAEGEPQAHSTDCSIQFNNSGTCLSWAWEKKPADSEFGSLIFKTYRLNTMDGSPALVDLPGAAALVLWMPSMGHGSSPTTVTRIDTGTYRATRVYFVMPGQWDLHFQSKNNESVTDEAIVSIEF